MGPFICVCTVGFRKVVAIGFALLLGFFLKEGAHRMVGIVFCDRLLLDLLWGAVRCARTNAVPSTGM